MAATPRRNLGGPREGGSATAQDPTAAVCVEQLRVAKKFRPTQDGAKRFALRYGQQLVCVRHRLSDDGLYRHTTVELLVETTPIVTRQRTVIALRIPANDRQSRALLIACGAEWQSKGKRWLVPHLVARNLRMLRFRIPMKGG